MRKTLIQPRSFDEDGFTLMELIYVIIIIGILAVISIPVYNGLQRTAIDATVKSDVRASAGNILKTQIGFQNGNSVLQFSITSAFKTPLLPASAGDLDSSSFVTPEQFATVAQVTDKNSLILSLATDPDSLKQYACLWGNRVFGEGDMVSWYYDSRTGLITQESCLGENFGQTEVIAGISGENVSPEATPDSPEATPVSPEATPEVNNNSNGNSNNSNTNNGNNGNGNNGNGNNGNGNTNANANANAKYPVCHASSNGKWKLLMLPLSAFNGHGSEYNQPNNVIPPVAGEYAGKNWNADGWATFEIWCS